MLELKRKAGQSIVVGDSLQLTVQRLDGSAAAHVQFGTEAITMTAAWSVGRSYKALVEGYGVEVELARIERGEAVFRFEAPRGLRIDRWERAV